LSTLSPIKTRLNARQNLLQQEEIDRYQLLKETEKRAKSPEIIIADEKSSPTKRLKLVKIQEDVQNETLPKKSRKSKQLESHNTPNTSTNMSPSNTPKADLLASKNYSNSPNSSSVVNTSFPGGSNNASFNNGMVTDQKSSLQKSTPITNPIYWQSEDISRYLAENKFEPHLIYLIKEHVS